MQRAQPGVLDAQDAHYSAVTYTVLGIQHEEQEAASRAEQEQGGTDLAKLHIVASGARLAISLPIRGAGRAVRVEFGTLHAIQVFCEHKVGFAGGAEAVVARAVRPNAIDAVAGERVTS